MSQRTQPFGELIDAVIDQLKSQKYMESTLIVYRRTYNRLHSFLNDEGTDAYTHEAGQRFLQGMKVCRSTITAYKCAVRRLDDFIDEKPYRCHHAGPIIKIPEVFQSIVSDYIAWCASSGNKPATLSSKEHSCALFLSFIENEGCTELSELNIALIPRALLVFSNKDHYARIRQFLSFLFERGITHKDYSGIVPRYKRRNPLPSVYTPEEINMAESVINTGTVTGVRNLAIIRLASRMGLRAGDIANLKLSEINVKTGNISIVQKKTGLPVVLQMPQDVMDALQEHLEKDNHVSEDGYVFHSMTAPYEHITPSIIRHVVNDSLNDAGIDISGRKHGPHALRSSLASSMVNDGVSYEIVRRILGHSDPDVIKHYAKADIENLRLCSLEPPAPFGRFSDYLSGKKVIRYV
ncbi:MAG: tyrosine-type recombinase/integrase [Lachnospiraceae bacterium]|nr:tyrosine-type recombinase/integrase [Lachnospiraceae bacterium]